MKTLPPIMQHPESVAVIEAYRSQFYDQVTNVGERVAFLSPDRAAASMLSAALGALDAAICHLVCFHRSQKIEFDKDEFLHLVGERVGIARIIVEMGLSTPQGGVQ